MQQATNKKKSNCLRWSDNVFDKIYWLPLVRYKRPNASELQQASEFFIYHYVHGTGEVVDWQNTLNTLLLGLKVGNCDCYAYVLANEDERKVAEPEIQLPWNQTTYKVECRSLGTVGDDAPLHAWMHWCRRELGENFAQLANYLGVISLFLCGLIVGKTIFERNFRKIDKLMRNAFEYKFNIGNTTPIPNKALFRTLSIVLDTSQPFAKEVVCRLTQQRLQLQQQKQQQHLKEPQQELHDTIIEIQSVAGYRSFEKYGAGLWHWFCLAKEKLGISDKNLLEMLSVIGDFNESVAVLQDFADYISKADIRTWRIARLLRKTAFGSLDLYSAANLLTFGVFVAIVSDEDFDTCKNKNSVFARLKELGQEGKAISVGRSLLDATQRERKHKINKNIKVA
ncbi:uncharacterized protein LOC128860185 [Anastrepha ludens]|uniref:uncharacterized protein LOC128860185 n=1 Tax=Anastrepha ludens TaxID=28586 RepID=UPI0023AF491C|nr:uncharacterized protein LOC128860185 [Anastrepha ludens]XP_053953480.1 uncharacterized protein LOC128860185 [Anastrepha ludens]